jgi:phosphomannomutase
MVGFDPRPQGVNGFVPGEMGESKAVAETVAAYGFSVLFVPKAVAAPFMISATGANVHPKNIYAAVMRTASHNEVVDPKSGRLVSGFKLFLENAPAADSLTGLISARINDRELAAKAPRIPFDRAAAEGRIVVVQNGDENDPDTVEFSRMKQAFDLKKVGENFREKFPGFKIALNTMNGGMSQFALRALKVMGFDEGKNFRAFNTTLMNDLSMKEKMTGWLSVRLHTSPEARQVRFAPDPTRWWMRGEDYREFSALDPANTIALLIDGDADRLVAELEKEIIPNEIGMLAAYYLARYKGQTGRIVRTVPTTGGLDALAKALGMGDVQITPVGSKWFAGPNKYYGGTLNDILVAVEESGHIGFRKNGQLFFDHSIGLATLMLEMMAETGKTWQELSDEMWAFIKEKTGQERIATVREGIGKDEGADKYYGLVARLGNPAEDAFRLKFAEKMEIALAQASLPWKVNGFDITDAGGAQLKFEGGRKLFPRKSGTDGSVRLYVEVFEAERTEVPKLVKSMRKVMDSFIAPSRSEARGQLPDDGRRMAEGVKPGLSSSAIRNPQSAAESRRSEIRTLDNIAAKLRVARAIVGDIVDIGLTKLKSWVVIARAFFSEHFSLVPAGTLAEDTRKTARTLLGIRTIPAASDVFVLGHEFFSQDYRVAAGLREVYPATTIVAIVKTAGERAFLEKLNLRLAKEGLLPILATGSESSAELKAHLARVRGTVRATALLYSAETIPLALKQQIPNTMVVTPRMLNGFLSSVDMLVSGLVKDLQAQFALAKSA